MASYSHLTKEERLDIDRYLQQGFSFRRIGLLLGRSSSTISREIRRNMKRWKHGYVHDIADQFAHNRGKKKRSKLHTDLRLQALVIQKLNLYWSPETISGWLKRFKPKQYICHETIYDFIYNSAVGIKGKLSCFLKTRRKKRIPFHTRKKRRSSISNITSIHERPKRANERKEVGHWEADLMMNKGGNVLVMIERKTRLMMAYKNPSKHANLILEKLNVAFNTIPAKLKKTIAFDRGTEFARHQELSLAQNVKSYFCDAYSPWQKGGVENANGRLRRFIPKKTDITHLTQKQLDQLINHLNNTPRKCLNYRTPYQQFKKHLECCTST